MCNRNCLHCSYPNTSDRTRITLNFGFHKRSAVDAAGELLRLPNGPDTVAEGDEVPAEIDRRCRAIPMVRHTFGLSLCLRLAYPVVRHAFAPPCACGWVGLTGRAVCVSAGGRGAAEPLPGREAVRLHGAERRVVRLRAGGAASVRQLLHRALSWGRVFILCRVSPLIQCSAVAEP